MLKSKFMDLVLLEGIIVTVIGFLMLLLPQIATIGATTIISMAIIFYGFYKFINSILIRKQVNHLWLNLFTGILLIILGCYMILNPLLNVLTLTALLGMYFFLESISNTAYSVQTRKIFKFWWINLVVASFQFLLALIILLGLPSTASWAIGLLLGVNFLFAGMGLISLFTTSVYINNEN